MFAFKQVPRKCCPLIGCYGLLTTPHLLLHIPSFSNTGVPSRATNQFSANYHLGWVVGIISASGLSM
ncbi:hypothetical protein XENTR_v10015551 [Xenopus tropicalis]|nr:hypothetical protein XENTR_v10015551 [Xenopus tropicalis]